MATFMCTNTKKEKNEETKPVFEVSEMLEAMLLKFSLLSTDDGRHFHRKNRFV